ncbi:MAG TPA: Crp/Fnr family transcriptional regulator [Pirellulales bacterium]|nr:Crp/Fnr family transcriptional regulator [Pirellulales bacterium]
MAKRRGVAGPPMNRLLAALPEAEFRRLAKHLELVPLEPGQVLLEPGHFEFVYFPRSGVVAQLVEIAGCQQIGAALIGREGMIPLCLFLNLDDTPFRAVVQNAGEAWRMPAETFRRVARPGQLLHSVLLRFTAAFTAQVSLAAACSRVHQVQQQCSRWLLMTQDRVGADEFLLTQEAVAGMLGVRRMSVTAAARQLRKKGLIEYRRGKVRVLDRAGLEQASCECFRRINAVYKSILKSF